MLQGSVGRGEELEVGMLLMMLMLLMLLMMRMLMRRRNMMMVMVAYILYVCMSVWLSVTK